MTSNLGVVQGRNRNNRGKRLMQKISINPIEKLPIRKEVKMTRGTIRDQFRAAGFQEKAEPMRGEVRQARKSTPRADAHNQKQLNPVATHQDPKVRKLPGNPQPHVEMTPDQQINTAKGRVATSKQQFREAEMAVTRAKSEVSRAENDLQKLLLQHNRSGDKRRRESVSSLTYSLEPGRATKDVPSYQETGPLQGMTKKVPSVEKAIRDAEEVLRQGLLHAKKSPVNRLVRKKSNNK